MVVNSAIVAFASAATVIGVSLKLIKMLGAILLLLALTNAVHTKGKSSDPCEAELVLDPRPHSVSITEFGAVGDGKADNTLAFQNAVFYLKSFADKGGAQLYVPAGRWLTGSFNLTSHLTLFLGKGAVILGSQDLARWETVDPLPSYGRGIDFPGRRYRSLINGYMLRDVVITGDTGTIDGQGLMWWDRFENGSLNYSRPHLIEFMGSDYVIVSNLTLSNPPAYGIHPVYCSDVHIHNVSISALTKSPHTVGIVPDSSDNVCVQESVINMGYDSIALKSGWDEYGIAFGRPTTNVCIRRVDLRSYSGSAIAFGSEMSGGISNIRVEHVNIHSSSIGIELRTTRGRGGYIKEIMVTDTVIDDVQTAFSATGQCRSHPDDDFDPNALPSVQYITLKNITGTNIGVAGKFTGIPESPFTPICLSNIWLSMSHAYSAPWTCSDVLGSSSLVFPEPCRELMSPSSCISIPRSAGKSEAS